MSIDILRIINSVNDFKRHNTIDHVLNKFRITFYNHLELENTEINVTFVPFTSKIVILIDYFIVKEFNLTLVKNIVQDYDSGEFTEIELIMKYGRGIFDDEILKDIKQSLKEDIEECFEYILSIFSSWNKSI